MIKNSAGKIFYGMHFYPGVAEYRESGRAPYRVFINESTIRQMSPTFAGRPIYVEHVDEVEIQDGKLVDDRADGYVSESFFNSADGKTWVKFIIVSERGEQAIKQGWRLSNAYVPKQFGPGGVWNGVEYEREVISGEYEHLAIVPNPRYEESVIISPEEFKKYNSEKNNELLKLANSKDKETTKMAFNFFKKSKVENSKDLEGMIVELPSSKKEIPLELLIKNADDMAMKEGKEQMCNVDHMVAVGDKKMSLNDLLEEHKKNSEELAAMKKEKDNAGGEGEESDIESMDNVDDEEAKKKALELAEHEEKEIVEKSEKKEDEDKEKEKKEEVKKNAAAKAAARKHFDTLKNAPAEAQEQVAVVSLSKDRVALGKSRYGSN